MLEAEENFAFDLLSETSLTLPMPTIDLDPYNESICYSWTWKLYRASDGADMTTVLAATTSTFTTPKCDSSSTQCEITLTHDTDDALASQILHETKGNFFAKATFVFEIDQTDEYPIVIDFKLSEPTFVGDLKLVTL